MNIGIYVITSPVNKLYIGQSWNISRREEIYQNNQCKHQPKILASLNKYGWPAHKFEVVLYLEEKTNQAIMDYWEQFFMDFYRAQDYELLNIKEGGRGGRHSEDTKFKIGQAGKGRKHSEEVKQKIKESVKKSWESETNRSRNKPSDNPNAIPILQFTKSGEFVKEWPSIGAAGKVYNNARSYISICCKTGKGISAGFKWEYKNV